MRDRTRLLAVLAGVACFAVVAHAAWRETLVVTEMRVSKLQNVTGTTTFVDTATGAGTFTTLTSGGATSVTTATAAQVDTNATTTTTGYTPAFVGQVLIGGAGTGTNGVWIAKGATTNDWVAVAP